MWYGLRMCFFPYQCHSTEQCVYIANIEEYVAFVEDVFVFLVTATAQSNMSI
jgi:hypothetical protein